MKIKEFSPLSTGKPERQKELQGPVLLRGVMVANIILPLPASQIEPRTINSLGGCLIGDCGKFYGLKIILYQTNKSQPQRPVSVHSWDLGLALSTVAKHALLLSRIGKSEWEKESCEDHTY